MELEVLGVLTPPTEINLRSLQGRTLQGAVHVLVQLLRGRTENWRLINGAG